jgi:hypothetical protein
VTLIEPDVFVAEDARDLRWKHEIPLSGADGLHVASALSVGCSEFWTTDEKRKSPIHQSSKLMALGLMAIKPSQTGLLSDERRQSKIIGVPAATISPPKRKRKKS